MREQTTSPSSAARSRRVTGCPQPGTGQAKWLAAAARLPGSVAASCCRWCWPSLAARWQPQSNTYTPERAGRAPAAAGSGPRPARAAVAAGCCCCCMGGGGSTKPAAAAATAAAPCALRRSVPHTAHARKAGGLAYVQAAHAQAWPTRLESPAKDTGETQRAVGWGARGLPVQHSIALAMNRAYTVACQDVVSKGHCYAKPGAAARKELHRVAALGGGSGGGDGRRQQDGAPLRIWTSSSSELTITTSLIASAATGGPRCPRKASTRSCARQVRRRACQRLLNLRDAVHAS